MFSIWSLSKSQTEFQWDGDALRNNKNMRSAARRCTSDVNLSLISVIRTLGWGWLLRSLPSFNHLRNALFIASSSEWQLNYHSAHWETAHSDTSKSPRQPQPARSDFTLYSLLLLSMASSNFITDLPLCLSVSLSLSLVTDVLNQWHPNSFTALFPWAWGFAADAFGVKSLSSRARPSLMHLGVGTITHAICTNCSICVWIWNAFPEYDWRPYLSPKRAVEMWGMFYPSLRLPLHLLFVMSWGRKFLDFFFFFTCEIGYI